VPVWSVGVGGTLGLALPGGLVASLGLRGSVAWVGGALGGIQGATLRPGALVFLQLRPPTPAPRRDDPSFWRLPWGFPDAI
jgi:hypothetical protein